MREVYTAQGIETGTAANVERPVEGGTFKSHSSVLPRLLSSCNVATISMVVKSHNRAPKFPVHADTGIATQVAVTFGGWVSSAPVNHADSCNVATETQTYNNYDNN